MHEEQSGLFHQHVAVQGGDRDAVIADFFRHVARGIPAGIGEHHRHQRQQPRRRTDRTGRGLQVRRRAAADGQADRDEDDQRRHLERGEQVADNPPRPDAADVNGAHQPNHAERHQRLPRHRQRNPGNRHDQQRRIACRSRHEASEVKREHGSAGRDGAGKAGDKRRPPGQKSGHAAERGIEVHVFAAGSRSQRGELGIRHRAGKRERAAGQPRRQKQPRIWNVGRDLSRKEENAAADHIGNDDGRRIVGTEAPLQRGFRRTDHPRRL